MSNVRYFSGRDGKLWIKSRRVPLAAVNADDSVVAETEQIPEVSAYTRVLKLTNWSVSTSLSLIETTTLESTHKTYKPNLVAYTGQATALYYKDEDSRINTASFLKAAGIAEGLILDDEYKVDLEFQLSPNQVNDHEATAGRNAFSISAFITSFGISVDAGELVRTTFNFKGTGAPIYAHLG